MTRQLVLALFTFAMTACVSAQSPSQLKSKPRRDFVVPRDSVSIIQSQAVMRKRSDYCFWGTDPEKYSGWTTHSNRLIPIYTFGTLGAGEGADLNDYVGEKSVYRNKDAITKLFRSLPPGTLNPNAPYCDQTDIYRLMEGSARAGKKRVFLVIFDGMDWHATRLAAAVKTGKPYDAGRGTGLFFQDYTANNTTQFGYMVTSPYCDKQKFDVDKQQTKAEEPEGGYDINFAGAEPWAGKVDLPYLIGKSKAQPHTYTDSSASATSMASGIKTYNYAINVDPDGKKVETFAHRRQREGWWVGVVTSVTFPHATPASMYAQNVSRGDYQDLGRDLLGLPSISNPKPLLGMDLVIGTGAFTIHKIDDATERKNQGSNFVNGNIYLTEQDLQKIDASRGGKYVVSQRTGGRNGREKLLADAKRAVDRKQRLFGFYGTQFEHLPFATANGDYKPSISRDGKAEYYSRADLFENPTLADMAEAALNVVEQQSRTFLMVEAGDVDWAMHANNVDNMVGAIYSGDVAVKKIADWIETHGGWKENTLIVTSDHGHLLTVRDFNPFLQK